MEFKREESRVKSWIEKAILVLRESRRILGEAPEDLKHRINAAIALLKPIALMKTRGLDVDYPNIIKTLENSYNEILTDIKRKADEYGFRDRLRELLSYMEDKNKRMLIAIAVG